MPEIPLKKKFKPGVQFKFTIGKKARNSEKPINEMKTAAEPVTIDTARAANPALPTAASRAFSRA